MANFHLKHFHFTWVPFLFQLVNHVNAQTSMEPVPTDISHHNWEPSFAVTVGAVICALLFMGVIAIYIRNCVDSHIVITRTNPITNLPCSCSQGINKELLNTFPILFYSTIKGLIKGKGPLECAVCLTDFKDHDTLRVLPKCNHVFHPQCIDSWLASHVTCPVCRANLNQDSCQVALMIPTHFSNDQIGEESSETRPESTHSCNDCNDSNNTNTDTNTKPIGDNINPLEGSNSNDGGVSKLKLLKSNSTGHSLVEPVKCVERYTLMLPEDVRRYILVNHGKSCQLSMTNNNSNMVKGLCWSENEGSSVEKSNNGEARVERWMLCTPPFVGRSG